MSATLSTAESVTEIDSPSYFTCIASSVKTSHHEITGSTHSFLWTYGVDDKKAVLTVEGIDPMFRLALELHNRLNDSGPRVCHVEQKKQMFMTLAEGSAFTTETRYKVVDQRGNVIATFKRKKAAMLDAAMLNQRTGHVEPVKYIPHTDS